MHYHILSQLVTCQQKKPTTLSFFPFLFGHALYQPFPKLPLENSTIFCDNLRFGAIANKLCRKHSLIFLTRLLHAEDNLIGLIDPISKLVDIVPVVQYVQTWLQLISSHISRFNHKKIYNWHPGEIEFLKSIPAFGIINFHIEVTFQSHHCIPRIKEPYLQDVTFAVQFVHQKAAIKILACVAEVVFHCINEYTTIQAPGNHQILVEGVVQAENGRFAFLHDLNAGKLFTEVPNGYFRVKATGHDTASLWETQNRGD